MSSKTSSDGGPRYKRLPPLMEQREFNPRRRSTKLSSSIPTLNKNQSSLTQLPSWNSTAKNPVPLSSDTEDEDYVEPPAKRRKSSEPPSRKAAKTKSKLEAREKGQSSFTQFPYLARMAQSRRSTVGEDGFQIWPDSEEETDVEDGSTTEQELVSSTPPAVLDFEVSENKPLEIAGSSQHDQGFSQHNQLAGEPKTLVKEPCTPGKVHFTEIPSSQTPPSTRLSEQRQYRQLSRSPLTDRSINASSPPKKVVQSPESQSITMKMLERTRFANQKARKRAEMALQKENQPDEDLERCAAEATSDFSLRTYQMPPPPPRKLQRTATVQDSQADELEALSEPAADIPVPSLRRTGTIPDSQRNSSNETLHEDSQQIRPPHKLRRVATVQNSQFGDALEVIGGDDDPIADEGCVHAWDNEQDDDDYDYEHHDDSPDGTFDPVYSALERDAGRFNDMQTQRRPSGVVEDSETEDEDLDRGCTSFEAVQTGKLPDEASQELGDPHVLPATLTRQTIDQPESNDAQKDAANTSSPKRAQHDDSAYESGDQVPAEKEIEVPSSPPPLIHATAQEETGNDPSVLSSPPLLRASQVSTVVPTQATMAPRPTSPRKRIKPEPFSLLSSPSHQPRSQAFSLLSSPYKASSIWQPESMESSPLPLPPWSSPSKRHAVDAERRRDSNAGLGSDLRTESLADFSLPPPPPLSSSRGRTPASSSS